MQLRIWSHSPWVWQLVPKWSSLMQNELKIITVVLCTVTLLLRLIVLLGCRVLKIDQQSVLLPKPYCSPSSLWPSTRFGDLSMVATTVQNCASRTLRFLFFVLRERPRVGTWGNDDSHHGGYAGEWIDAKAVLQCCDASGNKEALDLLGSYFDLRTPQFMNHVFFN